MSARASVTNETSSTPSLVVFSGGEHQRARWFADNAVKVILTMLAFGLIVAVAIAFSFVGNSSVTAFGALTPLVQWPARSPLAGRIESVAVQTGSAVRPGDLLLTLDSRSVSSEIERLEHKHAAAVARHRRTLDAMPLRYAASASALQGAIARMIKIRATARAELIEIGSDRSVEEFASTYELGRSVRLDRVFADLIEAAADSGKADQDQQLLAIDQAGAIEAANEVADLAKQLDQRRADLRYYAIRSPAAGIVLTDSPELLVGTTVASGEVLMQVAQLQTWIAEIFLSERDVNRIRVGDPARIRIPALDNAGANAAPGIVTSVAAVPRQQSAGFEINQPRNEAARFRVTIAIEGHADRLPSGAMMRPGYTVEAHIVTKKTRLSKLVWQNLLTNR